MQDSWRFGCETSCSTRSFLSQVEVARLMVTYLSGRSFGVCSHQSWTSKNTLQTQNDPVHLVNAMAHPEVKARAEDVVAYTASYAEAEGGI